MIAAALCARGISRSFGATRALSDVSLEVQAGELLAVLGPNGAGKTTLLDVLTGSARPTQGTIEIAGRTVDAKNPTWRASIGVVSHRSGLYGHLTALENLEFFATLQGLTDVDDLCNAALARVGLGEHAQRPVRQFSRGMAQRVAIARATLHQPQVLLFDEPFTGLDSEATAALEKQLLDQKKEGRAVVLVTHRTAVAQSLADRVLLLSRGRVIYNGTDFPRDALETFLSGKRERTERERIKKERIQRQAGVT